MHSFGILAIRNGLTYYGSMMGQEQPILITKIVALVLFLLFGIG